MRNLLTAIGFLCSLGIASANPETLRKERDDMVKRGLWKEALDHYREKLIAVPDKESGNDLQRAIDCLRNLRDWKQFDPLVEQAVATQPKNPHLLRQAASAYQSAPHAGRVIAGDFERTPHFGWGHHWGGRRGGPQAVPGANAGAVVQTQYRDRIRALQLLRQALKSSKEAPDQAISLQAIANSLMENGQSWKLQTLTPIENLPEWGEPGPEGGTEGAPWKDDTPVLHSIPESWEKAANDGERWRFTLAQRTKLNPDLGNDEILRLAQFSESQFAVSTLASYGWRPVGDPDTTKGILQVETLAEDECLAKTSDGVRRFKIAADHHFIALYQKVFDHSPTSGDALTRIFLNRRQCHKAKEALERIIAKHGPGSSDHRKKLLEQITGNWGRFENVETVASGTNPVLPLVFRNAESISLSASPVDVRMLLTDTIEYLKSNPRKIDYQQSNPSDIAERILRTKKSKYVGDPAKKWTSDLTPRELHRDTRTDLVVPVEKAGAWWITGKMQNGNQFHSLVWIIDSILVQRSVAGNLQWWLADAKTGAPEQKADIDFFGYRVKSLERKTPLGCKIDVKWKEFSHTTDNEGKVLLKPGDWESRFQWLAVANKDGKFPAFFGFQRLYAQKPSGQNGTRNRSYAVTDRPIYKPGDTVHLKFHLRNVGYANADERMWANQIGELKIFNGRGEESLKIDKLKTDAFGTLTAEFIIPKDASLGGWRAQFMIPKLFSSQASFRVEEYRKPEFEVSVEAPDEPVKLGDTFEATVKANYFHGAPVRNAKVEIIVKRSSVTEPWFPSWRWDWLYEPGAWWTQCYADWHPTWHRWGCIPPSPPWWGGNPRWTPDELILKKTVPVGKDGTAKVEIDTSPAKEIHGDMDARYSIEARVVDTSRREERGTGSVIAARKPFELTVWTNRGHSKPGQAIEATIAAATLTGKPVTKAKGKITLNRLFMSAEGKITEKEVQSWPATTDAEGRVVQKF